jgi:hypothetical protein
MDVYHEDEGPDGRTWRIQLRDGVRWQDGQPFTSKDVVFTLRYYRDGIANRWTHHVSDTPKLTTIEALDRLSLRVGCELPCPLFDKVTAADLVMLPAHLWRPVMQPNLYRGALIGTGPYRVTELASGRYLRLEANPDYFAGAPRIDSIIVSFIRNPATALPRCAQASWIWWQRRFLRNWSIPWRGVRAWPCGKGETSRSPPWRCASISTGLLSPISHFAAPSRWPSGRGKSCNEWPSGRGSRAVSIPLLPVPGPCPVYGN